MVADIKAADKAKRKWDAAHIVSVTVRLSVEKDADILEFWKSAPDKAGLFREMIREQIEKQKDGSGE